MTDATTNPPRIWEKQYDRAEELISALRPESPLWAPDPGVWIFRGHADATWRLLPSAVRREPLGRFVKSADKLKGLEGNNRYCYPRTQDVLHLLRDFADHLNKGGHPLPGPFGMGRLKNAVAMALGTGEDVRVLDELTSLGQHYGLPTMLLDWTRHATYAAYFAASDVADLEGDSSNSLLDVWALSTSRFSTHGDWYTVRKVEPPRAGNANLHSQGGVFTLTLREGYDWKRDSLVTPIAVDDAVREAPEKDIDRPMMRRLSLLRQEAPKVLELLAYERVAGNALFPGLDGVIRSVRDDRDKR